MDWSCKYFTFHVLCLFSEMLRIWSESLNIIQFRTKHTQWKIFSFSSRNSNSLHLFETQITELNGQGRRHRRWTEYWMSRHYLILLQRCLWNCKTSETAISYNKASYHMLKQGPGPFRLHGISKVSPFSSSRKQKGTQGVCFTNMV